MIVRELIEELLTYNLDAEVVTDYSESVRVGYIEETDKECDSIYDVNYDYEIVEDV